MLGGGKICITDSLVTTECLPNLRNGLNIKFNINNNIHGEFSYTIRVQKM